MRLELTDGEKEILERARAAGPLGAIYVSPSETQNLVDMGFLLRNDHFVDSDGSCLHKVADRAFPVCAADSSGPFAGVPDMPAGCAAVRAPVVGVVRGGPEAGFVAPALPAPARSRSSYQFDKLVPGGFVFVPAHGRPLADLAKSLKSTVRGAAGRCSERWADGTTLVMFEAKQGQAFGAVVAPEDGVYVVRVPVAA